MTDHRLIHQISTRELAQKALAATDREQYEMLAAEVVRRVAGEQPRWVNETAQCPRCLHQWLVSRERPR